MYRYDRASVKIKAPNFEDLSSAKLDPAKTFAIQ